MSDWPAAYLQPDRTRDCGFYAAAYLARCLGHPDVTAQQVKDWREQTRYHESSYARHVLGAEMRTFWDVFGDRPERVIFWLGPGARDWVREWLADGWLALVMVHRVPAMGHSVVLLDASDEGVSLMDPIYGHVTEPWEWFLGPGGSRPGQRRKRDDCCHHVDGWYRIPERH